MRRSILALLLGVAAGYWLGFSDADRGPGTLGAKVTAVMDRIHPDNVRAARQREASQFKQAIQPPIDVNP